MRVRVYKNLTKGCWSIQHKTPKGWRLLKHADEVILYDCNFIVSQAGRERVLRERKKYVHAFIEGELDEKYSYLKTHRLGNKITYNPYKGENFTKETGEIADKGISVYLGHGVNELRRKENANTTNG